MSQPHPFGVRFLVSFDGAKVSKREIVKKLREMGSHIVKSKTGQVEMILPPGQEDELTKLAAAGEVQVRPAGPRLDPKEWETS